MAEVSRPAVAFAGALTGGGSSRTGRAAGKSLGDITAPLTAVDQRSAVAQPDDEQGDDRRRLRMATRTESNLVYAAGLVQGIVLVTFPAASTIFTDPDEYGLSSSQYGAMFLPQVITAIAGSL